ncbi:MAG: peptidoglycan-binding domain-containing protein [Micrococcus sp.]|nr:peptidoglycan-binding domain-containing protein [Micrococcus sp.]
MSTPAATSSLPQHRVRTALLLILGALACAALGWWAATATLTSMDAPADTGDEQVWATAQLGQVGRTLALQTAVNQPVAVVATNQVPGVLTSRGESVLETGDTAYTVGATPVRVIPAETPFWRDLAEGADGDDVRALQSALNELGHLNGEPTGAFDAATSDAVRAWQTKLGQDPTGTIPFGELIAVPRTPVAITLSEALRPGAQLGGGEDAVSVPTGERSFDLVLSEEQARIIPVDAIVEVTFEDQTWVAELGERSPTDSGGVSYALIGEGGAEPCGESCDALPAVEQLLLPSTVTLVPEQEGVTVPAAAVHTGADGTLSVHTEAGEVPVTVTATEQGVAVVTGLDEGTRVLVSGPVPPGN